MLLAIESASDRASVAVGLGAADAAEESITGPRRHAGALLPLLQRALARRGVTLDQIRGIVLGDGPGSFTGLRVGAAVAKALVQARGLPLRTAPSLLARAAGIGAPRGALVLALADALRGEVYAAAYRLDGAVTTVLRPAVRRPEELASLLPAPEALVGDLPERLAAPLEQWAGRELIRSPAGAPRATTLLELAERPGGATPVTEASWWEPDYGRPAEAQARWEATHGRPLPDPVGGPR
jgi:tRNA threonylcarbamoyladenosine biosynthesis protein TsaB